jgi:hypothetical protein
MLKIRGYGYDRVGEQAIVACSRVIRHHVTERAL